MKNNEIKIKRDSSSLSEFVERQLPSDEEAEAFDRFAASEAKDEEIKKSLAKIYEDDSGKMSDIRKLTVKNNRGWFFNLFVFAVMIFVLAAAVYASYNYIYLKWNNSQSPVSVAIDAKKETAAGEEFFYTITYKNEDRVAMNNLELKLKYPDNFIFLDSDVKPSAGNDTWDIANLGSHRSDSVKIKGKLIGPIDSSNIILADLTYTPANFSSEFKKSASFETKINDLGVDFSFLNSSSALINEDNEIDIKFRAKDVNYLDNFRLSVEHPDEVSIIKEPVTASSSPLIQPGTDSSWRFSNLGKNESTFKIKFRLSEKKQPQITLKLKFDLPYQAEGQPEKFIPFYEQDLTYDVIQSDLNLSLIINGSPLDQGVDFGQTMNYSISYKNQGSSDMKDIIIMAVLESDYLDWQSLIASGQASGNTIIWTKSDAPALADLPPGAEGTIDFSIKLKQNSLSIYSTNYQIKSYLKYSIEGKNAPGDSQSNVITNKINSDLNLNEQLKYFNDDNIAVGYGPLPLKAGSVTGLKVYWSLSNNLHELRNISVNFSLPPGVSWAGKDRSSVGATFYDSYNNKISWNIDRLPASAKANAEFALEVRPADTDSGRIKIILPGTSVSAVDTVTGDQISKTLKAQTSKLETDNLADTDGIVQ